MKTDYEFELKYTNYKSSRGNYHKVIIPIKERTLSDHGYSTENSERSRHTAINKAIKHESAVKGGDLRAGTVAVERHLIARSNQMRRRAPEASEIMYTDAMWVQNKLRKFD